MDLKDLIIAVANLITETSSNLAYERMMNAELHRNNKELKEELAEAREGKSHD